MTPLTSSRRLIAAAFVGSRAIVLVAGILGATLTARARGWTTVDTSRLTSSFGAIGNTVAAPFVRWDSLSYLAIAQHGYTGRRQTAFFPGYPLLVHSVGWLTRSDVAAGVIVSCLAFGAALAMLYRLTAIELGRLSAETTVLLVAFAPVALFFSAVYTESLFLALSVGALLYAREGRWVTAGALAAGASVTRLTGVLLAIPLLLLWLDQPVASRSRAALTAVAAAPAGLGVFSAYLAWRGFGWTAPLQNQLGPGSARRFDGPLATLWRGARAAWTGTADTLAGIRPIQHSLYGPLSISFDSVVLAGVLAIAVLGLVATWRRLPAAYGAYALLTLAVVLSSDTRMQPLESFDRYALTIFPLWMGVGAWLSERRAARPVVVVGAGLLAFYSYAFATWAFVA